MYGLPEDFDPTIFVGRRLSRVCFAQNAIYFYFTVDSDELTVSLESSFAVQLNSQTPTAIQSPPVSSSTVMALIGRTVSSAKAKRDGTLTLTFDGGGSLQFFDD